MQYYEQILVKMRTVTPLQAEEMEEEINIMIHKLKFLPAENFPTVKVVGQNIDFAAIYSEDLHDKVKIAGGILLKNNEDKPQVVVILKNDDSLYSELPAFLEKEWLQNSPAYRDNRIFIIENADFGNVHNFLQATEILAEILQPKYFYFGHEGDNWTKFDLVHS